MTTRFAIHRLMERKDITFEEAEEELICAAEDENDRRRDDAFTTPLLTEHNLKEAL